MTSSLRLALRDDVSVLAGDGTMAVEAAGARWALRRPRPEIVEAMRRLAAPGEEEDLLAEAVLAKGGPEALARWYWCVQQLGRRSLIRRSLYADQQRLATLLPLGEPHAPQNGVHRTGVSHVPYVLSRFTYLRREGREMVVESPLAHARILLHDARAIVLVAALAIPSTIGELAERAGGISSETSQRFVDLLVQARMIEPVVDSSRNGEAAALEAWEFHDLLFHARSRRGRCDAPFGGTFRLSHRPPPAAVRRPTAKEFHALARPDLERLQRDDPPLALVQERRRSLRQYADAPVTVGQLGEFLYRVARVKHEWRAEVPTPEGDVQFDFASRPYPAGGGLYELEFYTAVRACRGLPGGLYHYDPQDHRLGCIDSRPQEVDGLLDEAAASAGIDAATLQVLIVLAARFERIAWKYESIAYALVLKHVGVVYQTMYLAATAMGLAPCALGCGDADLFARASGNNYYTETSVGEFLLGAGELNPPSLT